MGGHITHTVRDWVEMFLTYITTHRELVWAQRVVRLLTQNRSGYGGGFTYRQSRSGYSGGSDYSHRQMVWVEWKVRLYSNT